MASSGRFHIPDMELCTMGSAETGGASDRGKDGYHPDDQSDRDCDESDQ